VYQPAGGHPAYQSFESAIFKIGSSHSLSGVSCIRQTLLCISAAFRGTIGPYLWFQQRRTHLVSAIGPLFAEGGSTGSAQTGEWVSNGMVFVLVDASTRAALATTTVTQILP
jgi:hypothetical protein